jgi:uncharacterized RDD family membrane protein YckC
VTAAAALEGRRAGFVTRGAALFVDTVIVTSSLRTTAWVLEVLARALRGMAPPADLAATVLALSPLFVVAYCLAFWCTIGQTPGKWLMGIKVVGSDGGRVTVTRALLRVFGYLVSALPFYLGFLWVLGPRRLSWHDRFAHTEVVYVSDARGAPRRAIA